MKTLKWQLLLVAAVAFGLWLLPLPKVKASSELCFGYNCYKSQGQVLGEIISGTFYCNSLGRQATGPECDAADAANGQVNQPPANPTNPPTGSNCTPPSSGCGTSMFWDQGACMCKGNTSQPPSNQNTSGTFFCNSLNRQATAAECDEADKNKTPTNPTQPMPCYGANCQNNQNQSNTCYLEGMGNVNGPCSNWYKDATGKWVSNSQNNQNQNTSGTFFCNSLNRQATAAECDEADKNKTNECLGSNCPNQANKPYCANANERPECFGTNGKMMAPTMSNGQPTCQSGWQLKCYAGQSGQNQMMNRDFDQQGFDDQNNKNNQSPMMDEKQFKQEQKNIANTIKRINTEWTKAKKLADKNKIVINADCQAAYEDAKTSATEAAAATSFEEFNPGDFYSSAQPLQDCMRQIYDTVQFNAELKRTVSETKGYASSLKSYTTRAAKIKGDLAQVLQAAVADYGQAIADYKAALDEAKATVAQGEGDMGSFFQTLGDSRDAIREARDTIDALLNSSKILPNLTRQLKTFTTKVNAKSFKGDKAAATELINQINGQLTELKALLATKPVDFEGMRDVMEEIMPNMNDLQMIVQPTATNNAWVMPQYNNLNFVPAQYQQTQSMPAETMNDSVAQ